MDTITSPRAPALGPGVLSARRRAWLAFAAAIVLATSFAVVSNNAPRAEAATVDPNAWYVLQNRHSGKVMDVLDAASNDDAAVGQWSRNDGARQQFRFVSTGSGYYQLRSRESGQAIEVEGNSRSNGARIVLSAPANRSGQRWRLQDIDGHVQLINRNSSKALEVWEWATGDGARLAQYTDLDGANQQWRLIQVGDGTTTTSGSSTTSTTGPGGSLPPWPTPTGQVRVTSTQSVSGTFDGGLRRYYGIGDGGTGEDQDPMFELAAGATLRNVILGAPAGDGVHCSGSCTLVNVWWEDVGEDAATFRGASGSFLVDGGGARAASDKVFQHNGGGTVTIRNFQVANFGKLYRSCGNCSTQYRRTVVVQNVEATAPGDVLVGINTNYGDTATLSGITIIGNRNMPICDRYIGNNTGDEPRRNGSGADGTYCRYDPAAITYR